MSEIKFSINEKSLTNNKSLIIRGIATANYLDSEGERIFITPDAIKEALPIFLGEEKTNTEIIVNENEQQVTKTIDLQNNGLVKYNHGREDVFGINLKDQKVGEVLNLYSKNPDIEVKETENKLNDEHQVEAIVKVTDPQVINFVLEDKVNGFSLSWLSLTRIHNMQTGEYIDKKIRINELSVTPTPTVSQATFDVVTDEELQKQFQLGEKVFAYDQEAEVEEHLVNKNNQKYLKLNFPELNLKSKVKAESVKAYTTDFNESSFNNQIKKALKEKINDENYKISENEITNVEYSTPQTKLTFGEDGKYSTDFSFDSEGKISFHTKITNERGESKSLNKKSLKINIKSSEKKDRKKLKINIKAKTFTDYPKEATENAKKVLRWREKYKDEVTAMRRTGWIRANQLAKRKPISLTVVKKMAQFNRHRQNSKLDPEFKNEPWKDNGYVAWLGWGGDAGINWAIKKTNQLKKDSKNKS